MPDAEIERQIYFYWINAGRDEDGEYNDFDVKPYLETIRSLAPGEDGLYMPVAKTSDHLLAAVDNVGAKSHVRWFRARRSELPEVELDGTFENLRIADKAGLADKTHIVFFADNIVGADFNMRAPRVSSFARYLSKKGGSKPVTIEHLITRDALERLNRLETINVLDLRVTDPQLPNLDGTPFFKTFRSMMKDYGAYDVEVVLRKRRRSDENLSGLKGMLRSLVRRQPDDQRDQGVEKLKVKGLTAGADGVDEIDLLSSRLGAVANIQRIQTRSRVLDAQDAYNKIERAYKDLRDDIASAVSYRIAQS
jgi:hypothetical protein